jgi:predicted dehydrogenase
MALDMTPEQKEIGKANFHRTIGTLAEAPAPAPAQAGITRRRFMKGLLAAGATLPLSAAAYFGYQRLHGNPVRAGLIGAGDEGGVLVGEYNPDFLEFIAYSDIRPYNQRRIFEGEERRPGATLWRKGFNRIYGANARQKIRLHEDYQKLLEDPEIEMVVIALPLHLHAEATIAALRAGKHVLCEKLMARNITDCKAMIREARQADRLLAIGHQRHYSLLYAQTVELLQQELLGDVKHIRALWHRNNALPRLDANGNIMRDRDGNVVLRDSWRPAIPEEDRKALVDNNRYQDFGYTDPKYLFNWRLYNETGGGLMAELGSHQLDACSIFLGKVHPLAVTGVGGKYFYNDDREIEDHVFCTFEFPGKNHQRRPHLDERSLPNYNDVVVVNYSSISTNAFERYGECVMGSKGTLVVEEETSAMLWPTGGRSTSVDIRTTTPGQSVIDTSATPMGDSAAQTRGQQSLGGSVSRGYREEMEHLAYCIRMRDQGMARDREDLRPRCHGQAAMADAIVALTANMAMRAQRRIEFKPAWFDPNSDEVPERDPTTQPGR